VTARLAFALPSRLAASEPPEARGLARDEVRLLVARRGAGSLEHTTFRALPEHLEPGDLVVVNASATIPAAIDARRADGTRLVLHLSTRLDDGRWVVERRRLTSGSTARWTDPTGPETLALAGGATAALVAPYLGGTRLWVAELSMDRPVLEWLSVHGRPIRYDYVPEAWPLACYQTVYATEAGSAEMPSAGRPFTADVIARLVARGVGVTPVMLHTGVASLEADEDPYPERRTVPEWTAARVNATRAGGGRVLAVGTTVVRALESAADPDGTVHEADGWTDVVIGPDRPVRVVDAILTGWHEPATSHLQMLEAIAGRELLERSYAAALDEGYLFHEFGDSHVILP
jgi:S-adenosylmethionine:tRNA ribosyltransferase-isomerase